MLDYYSPRELTCVPSRPATSTPSTSIPLALVLPEEEEKEEEEEEEERLCSQITCTYWCRILIDSEPSAVSFPVHTAFTNFFFFFLATQTSGKMMP